VQEESEEALGRDRQEEVQEEKEEVGGAKARGGAMRKRVISFAVLTAVTSSLVVAGSAQASFHLNLIREVHEGGATGDYVELQAYAAGENLVGGKYVNTYDGGGGLMTSTLIPSNVPNGANQATILIAHDASTPGADVINAGLNVVNTGGTVCYSTSPVGTAPALDCVAYTSGPTAFPTPPPSPYGTPVSLPGGDLTGSTLVRSISRGCPTALDAADDTGNSAADFTVGAGTPRGNSVTPTETVCPPATATKKKCKKHKKKKSGAYSAKKKCKKHKKK
jgi:hypothetical protein